MDIYSFLLLVAVFGTLSVTGVKIYNVMHKAEKYDIKVAVLLFAAFMLLWFFGFVATTTVASSKITDVVGSGFESTAKPYEPIFIVLFNLTSWLMALNAILLFIEIVYHIGRKSQEGVKAFMSNEFLK